MITNLIWSQTKIGHDERIDMKIPVYVLLLYVVLVFSFRLNRQIWNIKNKVISG